MKLLVLSTILIWPFLDWASSNTIASLLDQLSNPNAHSSVLEQLKIVEASSTSAKQELRSELTQRLVNTADGNLWRSEVTLAGELDLADLAPIIAQSLDTDTRGGDNGISSMSATLNLENDPAGRALVSFGQQALPAVTRELNEGNRLGRYRATYVLMKIGGGAAQKAFHDRYPLEPDPGLKSLIGRHAGFDIATPH